MFERIDHLVVVSSVLITAVPITQEFSDLLSCILITCLESCFFGRRPIDCFPFLVRINLNVI